MSLADIKPIGILGKVFHARVSDVVQNDERYENGFVELLFFAHLLRDIHHPLNMLQINGATFFVVRPRKSPDFFVG